MFNSVKTIWRYITRRSHPAHLPYMPKPPDQNHPHGIGDGTSSNTLYSEIETNAHHIAGMSVTFGSQKVVRVDENNQAQDICQKQSYIIGSGRLVSHPDEVGGVCLFCQAGSLQLMQAGQISLEEAQLKSLVDKESARRCDLCGRYCCSNHCLSVQPSEGSTILACILCQKKMRPRFRTIKIVLSILCSPFLEIDNPNNEN